MVVLFLALRIYVRLTLLCLPKILSLPCGLHWRPGFDKGIIFSCACLRGPLKFLYIREWAYTALIKLMIIN